MNAILIKSLGRRARSIYSRRYGMLLILRYLAYLMKPRGTVRIRSDAWKWQISRLFSQGVESVHQTSFAIEANERIMQQFVSNGTSFYFSGFGGAYIKLPNVSGAKEIVVNDIREILVENIYESDNVFLEKNDIVIDCGASIGVFSIKALSQIGGGGRVICIEPVPQVRDILEHNLARLGTDNYVIIGSPIFRDNRRMNMILRDDCFTMHHLDLDMNPSIDKSHSFQVETVTIDGIVSKLGLERVDFVKMDVEGVEMDALMGARETLRRWKPRLAISAYHRYDDFIKIPEIIITKINSKYNVIVCKKGTLMCYAW